MTRVAVRVASKESRRRNIFGRAMVSFLVSIVLLPGGVASTCATTIVAQEAEIPNPFDLLPSEASDPSEQEAADISQAVDKEPNAGPAGLESAGLESGDLDSVDWNSEGSDFSSAEEVADDVARDESDAAQVIAEGLAEVEAAEFQPAGNQPAGNQPAARFRNAVLIDIEGPIFTKFHWYLNHQLDIAKSKDADLVIISMTTPGGDMESSLQLARRLRDVDWAEVVVFIPEEAISGGAIISLGADRIYMKDGALIGDAGPIRMGMGGQFEHAEEKVVSYLAGAVSELAEAKDRPGALVEAMVDRKLKVFEARETATGRTVYVTQIQADNERLMQGIEVVGPVPETGQNRFLTLAADRALELSLCDGVFDSESDMLQELTPENLQRVEMTWVDSTVFLLNRPWFTALLLVCGLVGLYIEFAAPGISVAGLSSLVCFGIFFWSHALGGTSGWLEFVLFLLGIVCILCELFVLPGFGVFGLTGIGLLVLSLVMASQNFIVPETDFQWGIFQRNLTIVLGAVFGVLILLFAQVLFLDSLPGLNRLKLRTPREAAELGEGAELGADVAALTQSRDRLGDRPAVGQTGVADSDLRPSGKVRIEDRLIDVVTEGDYVTAGTPVAIIKVEGNRVVVRKKVQA